MEAAQNVRKLQPQVIQANDMAEKLRFDTRFHLLEPYARLINMLRHGKRDLGTMVSGSAIVVSPSDKRAYEFLRLPNGLSALVISDPDLSSSSKKQPEDVEQPEDENDDSYESDNNSDEEEDDDVEDKELVHDSSRRKMPQFKMAAAALSVNVGSYSDPPDVQGLAHLLEHMLFEGNAKFPVGQEYDAFLGKHGGFTNAFTMMETTTFHFDVDHLHLKPALERFSQMFISPLFKADSIEREIQHVDSECIDSSQEDNTRLEQLMCSTANPLHPYNCFAWGSKNTLHRSDIREKLVEFYKQHYQAQRMALVVLGGEPLEILKGWVWEFFQDVPQGLSSPPTFASDISPWTAGKLYRVESVEDQHSLSLSWPLPCLDREYLKKPMHYMSQLIQQASDGSVAKFLLSNGWATKFKADVGRESIEHGTPGHHFRVDIVLTTLGISKIYEIIGHIFEYVRMLQEKTPQKWVFEELQATLSMDFKFLEEDLADDYVMELAESMAEYPTEHILYGDFACELWDPKLLTDLLGRINPSNMRCDFITKSFDKSSPGVLIEPWFGVAYTVEEIPEDLMAGWSHPVLNTAFHLPGANEFIARDLSIRRSPDLQEVPSLLLEESCMKVWYKLDQTFQQPKASVYILIIYDMDSLHAEVLVDLYLLLLQDVLNDALFMADIANISSSIVKSSGTVEIKVHGFSDKLGLLVQKICEHLKLTVEESHFQAMKEQLGQTYRKANLQPIVEAFSVRRRILLPECRSNKDKLKDLSSISVEDLRRFIPRFFKGACLEVLCHGNMSKEEAHRMVQVLKASLPTNDLMQKMSRTATLEIPINRSLAYDCLMKNEQEESSAAEIYFQVDDSGSLQHRALAELFEEIVDGLFRDELSHIGRRVNSGALSENGKLGFFFRVESPKHDPKVLQDRIETFLNSLKHELNDISADDFQEHKDSLIVNRLGKDSCLEDESNRYWEHIRDQRYMFEEPKLVASQVEDLTKKDLVTWFKNHIQPGGSKRRGLCIRVWGRKFKAKLLKTTPQKKRQQTGQDEGSFRKKLRMSASRKT